MSSPYAPGNSFAGIHDTTGGRAPYKGPVRKPAAKPSNTARVKAVAPPSGPPVASQPQAKPAGPRKTPSYTGPEAHSAVPYGQPGYKPADTGAPRHKVAPKPPSEADLLFRNAVKAIGPDVVKKASNPPVAGLQNVLGAATGIPTIVGAARSGHHLGSAGVAAAGLLPAGRLGRAAEELAKLLGAGRAAKTVGRVEGPLTRDQAVMESLKGAKFARAEQETLRKAERAARIKAYALKAQENPTEAGHHEALSALAGKYPALHWGGFEQFDQNAVDAMHKFVTDHPNLREWQKVSAKTAITDIRNGKVPTKSSEKLLRQVFGHGATDEMVQSVSTWRKARQLGLNVANIPRSVMASFDVSGAARQALLLATGHPVVWSKNVGPMFKALGSEGYYTAKMDALHEHPLAVNGVFDKMGLDLTELSPKGSTALREEPFASPLAEKIPGVRMSGRAFTYFLDKGRVDLASHLYAKAAKQGLDVNDQHLLESIGDVVNSATGRGDLGHGVIGRSADGINLLLFSPRLIKSRVDFLNPVWYAKLHPLARHEAYRAVGGLAALMTTALTIAHEAGAGVNLDPRSSDFAKIKIGNTRIDLAGGFQQYIRILSEIATQQTVTSRGETIGLAPFRAKSKLGGTSDMTILMRFLRNKLAPVTSAVVDVASGQNAVGQPVTLKNTLLPRVTPLSGQDAVSVGQDTSNATESIPAGVLAGVGAFGLAAFGGGVQNYKPRPKKRTGRGGGSIYAPSSRGSRSIYAPSGP